MPRNDLVPVPQASNSRIWSLLNAIKNHKGIFIALVCSAGAGYKLGERAVANQLREINDLIHGDSEVQTKLKTLNDKINEKKENDPTTEENRNKIRTKMQALQKKCNLTIGETNKRLDGKQSPSVLNSLLQIFRQRSHTAETTSGTGASPPDTT